MCGHVREVCHAARGEAELVRVGRGKSDQSVSQSRAGQEVSSQRQNEKTREPGSVGDAMLSKSLGKVSLISSMGTSDINLCCNG